MNRILAAISAATLLAGVAHTQDGVMGPSRATVSVAESEAYGTHLVNEGGVPLFLFVVEDEAEAASGPMTRGVRERAGSCTGGCREAWWPLTADGVEATEGVDGDRLYVADGDVRTHVLYDGWPLYEPAPGSEFADAPYSAHGLEAHGGRWYLVASGGGPVRSDTAER
ncbi:MAG: hypothetical protein U5K81_13025 [Trueperaceae bacterium]|nr:hypothetical protein [Trueperaceae bacterium]